MQALHHIDIQNLLSHQGRKVHRLPGRAPELFQNRPADAAKQSLIADSRSEPYQSGPNHVRRRVVAEKIPLSFKMLEEAVRRALVQTSQPRNILQLQSGRRAIQKFQNAKYFSNDANRRDCGLTACGHRASVSHLAYLTRSPSMADRRNIVLPIEKPAGFFSADLSGFFMSSTLIAISLNFKY